MEDRIPRHKLGLKRNITCALHHEPAPAHRFLDMREIVTMVLDRRIHSVQRKVGLRAMIEEPIGRIDEIELPSRLENRSHFLNHTRSFREIFKP